ncbi:NAD-dependent epimerase/dehydratase family protein [Cryobacterium sp. TMS1-20-1]|uniref:NAD-dependent epimerase/dehydratase family protein n=1 Tax=unclassified Cryobacterium TaxID=2649013 RepID=UPI00106CD086|nr:MULTISPECIES: NAD-dependent epimerase/dehydratase family protein [unclassified Cryobacterium]TFC72412.1 NAD-dependent epimerase/dehydratase family protein [Cryobacterium sp. TMS1-20-1]TFD55476.1 NAD-dependent epimerase/dehydratase family protein [Cryobacterium sp. Hh7]
MTAAAWVIGARGMLGRATTRQLESGSNWLRIEQPSLPWNDDSLLEQAAERGMRELLHQASTVGGGWAVFWAAGTVVTSSPAEAMTEELRQFRVVLSAIERSVKGHPLARRGCIFFASSAGGVYGGSANPPFTELTMPVPISPYGHFKLHGEAILEEFSRRSGVSSLSGRISNLYGPGQRLDKMQGLISHVARAQYTGPPTSIYVPLDTLRDYIFVTDCAALIADSTLRALEVTAKRGTIQATKNLISGRAVTISSLLGYFRVLSKGHPRVMLGSSAAAALQALDLRLDSVVWTDLDDREQESLPSGITATMMDILAGIQRGTSNAP